IGDGPRFSHRAQSAFAKTLAADVVVALQFLAGQRRDVRRIAESEMLGDIDPIEAGETAHADVVKMREQKCVDEVPAIDGELRVIDCLLRDLESRRAGTEKSVATSPVEFDLRLSCA